MSWDVPEECDPPRGIFDEAGKGKGISDELKPCPFCGESPDTEDVAGVEWVFCGRPDCLGGSNEESATTRNWWNTRPIESALAARVSELEAQLAAPREPGELADERIEQEARRVFHDNLVPFRFDLVSVQSVVALVRRCLAIDRASRPAPKWVGPKEYNALLPLGWKTVCRDYRGAGYDYYLMCPPVTPPTEGEK